MNPLLKLFFYSLILTNNYLLLKIYCENIVETFYCDFLFFFLSFLASIRTTRFFFFFFFSLVFYPPHTYPHPHPLIWLLSAFIFLSSSLALILFSSLSHSLSLILSPCHTHITSEEQSQKISPLVSSSLPPPNSTKISPSCSNP